MTFENELNHVKSMIISHNMRGMLSNGNSELFLKGLFVSYYDISGQKYALDKNFLGHEIDALVYTPPTDANNPITINHKIEFKSTLWYDDGAFNDAAEDAAQKAITSRNLDEEPWNTGTTHIVHFIVNSHFRQYHQHEYISSKFRYNPQNWDPNLNMDNYSNKYGNFLANNVLNIETAQLIFDHEISDCGLFAIIVNLPNLNEIQAA